MVVEEHPDSDEEKSSSCSPDEDSDVAMPPVESQLALATPAQALQASTIALIILVCHVCAVKSNMKALGRVANRRSPQSPKIHFADSLRHSQVSLQHCIR